MNDQNPQKLYLDRWIEEKTGMLFGTLSREALEKYQLAKLAETVEYAKENSSFYAQMLRDCKFADGRSPSFEDFRQLPFTDARDLRENGTEMVCVPMHSISRIVTMETSGTSGKPKRIYFTEEDQELTVDFFHHGMQNVVGSDDKVLILMPCLRPGSIGDLLEKGLVRFGANVVTYGMPADDRSDEQEILKLMKSEEITSIVAQPKQLARLARASLSEGVSPDASSPMSNGTLSDADSPASSENEISPGGKIRSVLLSAEYVSQQAREDIADAWGCRIFEHYGMTEMGLGGAVGCRASDVCVGYHPREADLYLEIIDPATGEQAADGEYGEIVFTTLTRKGMPFIRYRTGDISRWLKGPCSCGSILRRLDRVGDRKMVKGGEYYG